MFLLTPDELREAAAAFPRRDQRSRVAARRAEMEYFRHLPVPPTLGAPPSAPAPADPVSAALAKFFGPPAVVVPIAADTSTIRGRRGSPGKATGTARVLTSLADAHRLQPRDVLVAATTAPPWTPLFATVAAVVSDTGGILSHCAVVAR